MEEQKFQRALASYNQEQDFLKHLTTLSTGSIILMVTFLEKLFANPEWRFLVGISLIAFTLSIVGSLSLHFQSFLDLESDPTKPLSRGQGFFVWVSFLAAIGGFLVGLVTLVTFAFKNFY